MQKSGNKKNSRIALKSAGVLILLAACTYKPLYENKSYDYKSIKTIAVKDFYAPKDFEHIGRYIKDTFILELNKNNIDAVEYKENTNADAVLSGVVIRYTPQKRYIVIESTPVMQIYPADIIYAQDITKSRLWFTSSEIKFLAKLTSKDGKLLWQDEFEYSSWLNTLSSFPYESESVIREVISRISSSGFFKKFSRF